MKLVKTVQTQSTQSGWDQDTVYAVHRGFRNSQDRNEKSGLGPNTVKMWSRLGLDLAGFYIVQTI